MTTTNIPSGSEASGSWLFTGYGGSDLMRFNLDQVPLIFTQLEEVRRSLARLCFQRNRLEKEVRNLRIKRKEINQLGDAGKGTATDNKRIG